MDFRNLRVTEGPRLQRERKRGHPLSKRGVFGSIVEAHAVAQASREDAGPPGRAGFPACLGFLVVYVRVPGIQAAATSWEKTAAPTGWAGWGAALEKGSN